MIEILIQEGHPIKTRKRQTTSLGLRELPDREPGV